ncbi:MAG: hypothetical protein AB8G22_01220 [Saprospiraceae bacterium]
MIQILIEQYKQDINKAYNGAYPIECLTGWTFEWEVKRNLELIDKLVKSGTKINWELVGNKGKTMRKCLAILLKEYEFMKQNKKFGKEYIDTFSIRKILTN